MAVSSALRTSLNTAMILGSPFTLLSSSILCREAGFEYLASTKTPAKPQQNQCQIDSLGAQIAMFFFYAQGCGGVHSAETTSAIPGSTWNGKLLADPRTTGRVAQLVEQCPFKAWVAGSNPAALTINLFRLTLQCSHERSSHPLKAWHNPGESTRRRA